MDKVVQKNAASAEETSSAAEEMNAQAKQMKGFVAELLSLVHGGKNGNGVVFRRGDLLMGTNHSQVPVATPKFKARPEQFQKAIPKPANGKRVKPAIQGRVKEIRPDQLIPLGEGDFKEF
jgi:methyl-accepting chemotaxis protein